MEHMVQAVVFPGPLQGEHVLGLLHHADGGLVPAAAAADRAQLIVCQIAADLAGVDFLVGVQNGLGKALGLLLGHAQHVVGQPLGGLVADAGQAFEFLHQLLQGRHVILGHLRTAPGCSSRRRGRTCAPPSLGKRPAAPR